MTIEQAGKYAAAILAISAVIGGPVAFFQSKAAATEAEQKQAKSVNELRAEILLQRVKQLAEKEAKEGLTPSEKVERDLNLKQIEVIQAEAVKPK